MRTASLFAGCGGMDLGFQRAGHDLVWANESDERAATTHEGLLGGHVCRGDLASVVWPERGGADLVIGGPPCQGFSIAGKMDPTDGRSRLVFTFMDFVDHVAPSVFVMENVKALHSSPRWARTRSALCGRAEGMGYSTQLLLLNANDHGARTNRWRMFLVGSKVGSLGPVHRGPGGVLRDALAELPRWGTPGNDTINLAKIQPAPRPVVRGGCYSGMMFNGPGRPLCLDRPAPTLAASMSGNGAPIIDQLELDEGGEPWVRGYHAHLKAGGHPYTSAPSRLRRLTVEEAAAIQGFPCGTAWSGPPSSRYRQIGNAVPPPLAEALGLAVKRMEV